MEKLELPRWASYICYEKYLFGVDCRKLYRWNSQDRKLVQKELDENVDFMSVEGDQIFLFNSTCIRTLNPETLELTSTVDLSFPEVSFDANFERLYRCHSRTIERAVFAHDHLYIVARSTADVCDEEILFAVFEKTEEGFEPLKILYSCVDEMIDLRISDLLVSSTSEWEKVIFRFGNEVMIYSSVDESDFLDLDLMREEEQVVLDGRDRMVFVKDDHVFFINGPDLFWINIVTGQLVGGWTFNSTLNTALNVGSNFFFQTDREIFLLDESFIHGGDSYRVDFKVDFGDHLLFSSSDKIIYSVPIIGEPVKIDVSSALERMRLWKNYIPEFMDSLKEKIRKKEDVGKFGLLNEDVFGKIADFVWP